MKELFPALLSLKLVLVGGWFLLFFLAERLAPAARPPAEARGWARPLRNAGLWLVNSALSPALVLPISAWAAAHPLWTRPDWLAGWSGLPVDLLVLDFLIYWWHRGNHELPFLWRWHEVHHLDRFLDSTSAVRFHFGEVLLSALARAAAIVLLAVPFTAVVAFEMLLLAAAIFHHSNVRLPGGLEAALARVVITPSLHWVHHHRVRHDTDSTYGTVLSVWDRLFATRSATRRWPDMPIGVAGQQRDQTLLGLVLRPFRPR